MSELKKISGNDILRAIGELPEDMLTYSKHTGTRAKIFKEITIAASAFICIGVIIYALIVGGLGKFEAGFDGMDMESNNASPPSNGSLLDSVAKLPSSIIIDSDMNIINSYEYDNNYLQLLRKSNNLILIEITSQALNFEDFKIYSVLDNELIPIEHEPPISENFPSRYYNIEVTEYTTLTVKNTASGECLNIEITVRDDIYLLKVIKGGEELE